MWRYLRNRLLQTVPTLAGVVLISMLLTTLSGSPVRGLLGQSTSPEVRKKIEEYYGLDRSLPERFLGSLVRTAQGDLGPSIYNQGLPARSIIADGLAVTFRVALGAILVAVTLGLLSGLLSAWRPYSLVDYAASAAAAAGVSVPAFFLGMLLMLLFSVKLRWFPIGGYRTGHLQDLILPCLALGLIMTASISRLSRNCLLETLTQDYIRTARAKGLPGWRILLGHAFPNALTPVVTVIANDFAGLLCGAMLTETVFDLPGLGTKLYAAISNRDLPVVMGCSLVMALVFIVANFVVDLLYAFLDPRIRHGR